MRVLNFNTVTGAISRTGIGHKERVFMVELDASMHLMSKSDLIHEEKQLGIRKRLVQLCQRMEPSRRQKKLLSTSKICPC